MLVAGGATTSTTHAHSLVISDVLVQGPKAAVAAAAAARQNENSTITKIACHCR